MSMLGSDADLGVVLFTSRDASHYQQGQGTQLLHEIALMLPELLVVLPEAKEVGSVAMSMLGSDADLGVVLFTSRDAVTINKGRERSYFMKLR